MYQYGSQLLIHSLTLAAAVYASQSYEYIMPSKFVHVCDKTFRNFPHTCSSTFFKNLDITRNSSFTDKILIYFTMKGTFIEGE